MLLDKIDICNMALANLGQPPIQSIDERGVSAEACRLRYDEARIQALSGAPWRFATTWENGVALLVPPKPNYAYAFAYPAEALNIFYIAHPDETDAPDFEVTDIFLTPGKMISTNEPAPVFVYTRDKEDVTTFEPEFVNALAWLLAGKIAMPITKDLKIQDRMLQRWEMMRTVAEARTKNEGANKDDRLGFYHEARY